MEAICNFLPRDPSNRDIEYHHFVYEADLKTLKQPFVRSSYIMHLAYKGEAMLRVDGVEHLLTPGTLFITFPYQQYQIIDRNNFTYLYISFGGVGAEKLLSKFDIKKERMVFESFSHVTDFWMTSIRRINPGNILVLTESVLLYTLSYISQFEQKYENNVSPEFNEILQYIENNLSDPGLSIGKLADIFSFNKKYLSALFSKNMPLKFTEYLAKIRIEYAVKLIENQKLSVSELASKCGFTDPFYFSKIFKKITGTSPSKYQKGVQ